MGEEKRPNTDGSEKGAGQNVDMKKEILSWVFYIGFVLVLTWVIITFVGQRTRVDGRSMENTLHNGDNLIVEKLSYRFSDPKRFDIIVFPPTGKKEYYIKRIIGLPGETVQIKDGQILINGEVYNEKDEFPAITNAGLASEPITVGKGQYFVLGDNRNNSEDSRHNGMGLVDSDRIVGKLWFTISPWKKIGFV